MKKVYTVLALVGIAASAFGQAAIAPSFFWNPGDAAALTKQFKPDGADVTARAEDGAFVVDVAPGGNEWPGFGIVPASGATWDFSPWGHVEALVTNLSDQKIGVGLRVDNPGDWKDSPWNSESLYLDPGKSGVVKVIFGYQYGFQRGYRLDPSKVSMVKLFLLGKSGKPRSFKVSAVQANGPAKEKPPVAPDKVVTVPPAGQILPLKGLEATASATGGATASLTAKGSLAVKTAGDPKGAAALKPKQGMWNLGEWLKVSAVVRNAGTAPIHPVLAVQSTGDTIRTDGAEEIAPGKTGRVELSFLPKKPWVGLCNPDGSGARTQDGTGTKFDSHRVRAVSFSAREPDASFEVLEVRAEKIVAKTPSWLGKRPPDGIEGDWKLTFHDEFNGKEVDQKTWNIYTANYWDKRTHFTKDDIFTRNGNLVLRYEQKRGRHNDDPEGAVTDYAAGFADSYGKWTQKYGYFEARMKLPRCPGLWPAFWMMPDRGEDKEHPEKTPQWVRASTENGGMEFDIMEHLTAWGPYRFNIAAHWDGYGKGHKSIGSSWAYVPGDKDDYFTIGLLWLPGKIVYYGNGVEFGRWESERVSDQPSYPIFYIVQGGWANVPLDEDQLPAEFLVDYIRVWQRADLAE